MASRSGRSSRSSLMHTKRSFMYAAVDSSSNDSRSITWHQWHAEYPIESRIGLSSSRARASASSPHGYQSTGLSLCCSRYGDVSCARRFGIPLTLPGLRRDYLQVCGGRDHGGVAGHVVALGHLSQVVGQRLLSGLVEPRERHLRRAEPGAHVLEPELRGREALHPRAPLGPELRDVLAEQLPDAVLGAPE